MSHHALVEPQVVGSPLRAALAVSGIITTEVHEKRVQELLEANNRYLQRARDAERTVRTQEKEIGQALKLIGLLSDGNAALQDRVDLLTGQYEAVVEFNYALSEEIAELMDEPVRRPWWRFW